MKRGMALLAIPMVAMVAIGCVSTETYTAAVEESETLKAELDRTQTQTKALEQQLKGLQDQTGKLNSEADLAKAEVQRLRDSGSKELEGFQSRSRELDHKLKEVTAQQRIQRHEVETMKQRNKALEASVVRLQKELKEKPPAPPVSPPPPVTGPAPLPSEQEAAALRAQEAQSAPKNLPQEPAPPQDEGLLAAIKRWLMSVWHWFF